VRTRDAYGRVTWAGPPRGLAGITVEVRRAGDDAPTRAATFSDGEFYFPRLPAGSYTLSISPSSLQALRAAPDTPAVTFTVPAAPGAEPVQIPPIQLRPAG
jgi:hypothetical protein